MKRTLALILTCLTLLASPAFAQTPMPQTPPDVLGPMAADAQAIQNYKSWLERSVVDVYSWIATQQTTQQALQQQITDLKTQMAVQSQTIGNLQSQMNALITPATPPAAPIHIEAESITIPSVYIGSTTDIGGGAKITLIQGTKYSYTFSVASPGNYIFSARLGSDPATTGSTSVHFEYPAGTNATGPITAAGGGTWGTALASKAVALPAGSVTVVFVVDSLAPSGNSYLNFFEGKLQ